MRRAEHSPGNTKPRDCSPHHMFIKHTKHTMCIKLASHGQIAIYLSFNESTLKSLIRGVFINAKKSPHDEENVMIVIYIKAI